MIKFFNKTRQTHLSNHKFRKYLLYALGEIVLVVIGILIALSINSWNSDRLQRAKNKQLLFKMTQELDQHSERITATLDSTQPAFKFRLIYIDSVFNMLDRGIEAQNLEYIANAPSYYNIAVNLNTIVFEELVNTGSLYALGSDSLVAKIQNYYQRCEKETFYNLDLGEQVLDLKQACNEGFIDFVYWYRKNPEKAIDLHSWIFEPQSEPYSAFRNYIMMYKTHSNMMVSKLIALNKDCYELKRSIYNDISQQWEVDPFQKMNYKTSL